MFAKLHLAETSPPKETRPFTNLTIRCCDFSPLSLFDSRCPGYSLLPRFQEDWEELDIRDDARNATFRSMRFDLMSPTL